MRNTPYLVLCSTLFFSATGAASATGHNATDAAARTPRLFYESAFADYVPAHDVPLQSWQAANAEVAAGSGHAGHDMGGSGAMVPQLEPKPAASAATSSSADTGAILARGVVQQIDKPNGKVKLSHEPIEQLGWPKMTMFMRLKSADLADQVKVGDSVEFELEKAGSGYVISSFSSSTSKPADPAGKAVEEKPAAAKASNTEKPASVKPVTATKPAVSATGIRASGKIVQIDKANAKVKITHEPIAEIGWPKMTMFFRVKDTALLDQAKEGAEQQFTLEKSGSGYVISGFGT